MNWDQIEGKWKQYVGEARKQWGKLTDNDVEVARGDRDKLSGRIQERYGITKDEADKQIDKWSQSI